MKKKLLAFLLVVALVLSCVSVLAACKDDSGEDGGKEYDGSKNNDFKVGGKVILGNTTELSGDFRWAGLGSSSAGASDQDVQGLISGYGTMELDKAGVYQWNQTVVKSHEEKEVEIAEDGSTDFLVTIEINPGLKLSDGSELTAKNYLAYLLAMSTPVSKDALGADTVGMSFAGYAEYKAYNGKNAGEGIKKEFAGLRLLDTYKFSMQIDGSEGYYPYYYADTLGAVSPYDVKLCIGNNEIKDDGNGCYLSDGFYAHEDKEEEGDGLGDYVMKAHLKASQFDYYTYAFTGPYTIEKWNATTKEATLKLNPHFAGNWEGQKPHIETIVYRHTISETQNAQLASGEITILEAITGGDEVKSALKVMNDNPGKFASGHYDRAGYGKIEFECDFGPTMFTEVRQAVAYCLDRQDFANTFTGGYGSVVNGPYSVNFGSYVALEDKLESELNAYSVSAPAAKAALAAAGWTYNSKGEDKGANWTAGSGVDQVRYKKLSAAEAIAENINYKAVSLSTQGVDGVEYKTVKVGDDYYMPLVINWFCSENNSVSDLLTTKLLNNDTVKEIGMRITKTEGTFTLLLGQVYRDAYYGYNGVPTYGMLNLATGWNTAMYDYSYNWIGNDNPDMYNAFFDYSSNKISDPYDKDFSWWNEENQGLSFAEASQKSGGKLGMNYISFAMVYSVELGDEAEYNKWFEAYMVRWNELLPDIPLYSNIYYDVYSSNILNYKTSPFFGAADAILYCACADAQ